MKAKRSPNYENYQNYLRFKSTPFCVHNPEGYFLLLAIAFLGLSAIPVLGATTIPRHYRPPDNIAAFVFVGFMFFCLFGLSLLLFKTYFKKKSDFQKFTQDEKKTGKGRVVSKYWHSVPTIAGAVSYYIIFKFKDKMFRQRTSLLAFKKTAVDKDIDILYSVKNPHLCQIKGLM